jgi:tetratricopeptide (TPR) repeat protein
MAGLELFTSYSGKDRPWAVWLDFVLREAGHNTTMQEYDFLPGKSFVEAIDQALRTNDFVVCLLSPPYLASRWCKEEWQAALYTGKLFLLRIAECELDGILAPHAYVDLVGTAEAEAKERVLAALAKLEGKNPRPSQPPKFPAPAQAQARPRFPGVLPGIWNIAEERNPYFTGRDEILRQLHEDLGSGKQAALTQAISGLGGVGKTQLALEYAYRHASDYEGVWWLHAESPATLAAEYAALGPHLGIDMMTDQGAMIREVRARLAHQQGILLIFDNATEPSALNPYLPLGPGRRVIVTTRAQYWPGARAQKVREFELEQAVKFLLERSQQSDRAAAEEVANRLGCLPLALEQAAAYVAKCGKSLADYSALLKQRGLEVLEKGQPYQYEETVGTTWDLAFDKVKAECPPAVELLYPCAFLAPEAIYIKELAADEVALDEAKAALLGYSLVHGQGEGESISIHRLVSEVIRKRMVAGERESWLRVALRIVNRAFPSDSDDVRTWPQCSRWLAHALTVVDWDKAAEVEASACATILNHAGLHLKAMASYREAEPLFRRALAIFEQRLGLNHPHVAACLNNLALLLRATNRLAEAEPLFRRALAIGEQSLGPNHPEVATALSNLAELLQATNRLAEAEPLCHRALAIFEQRLGLNHPHVASALNNLALLLKDTNRRAEAEPLFRRAFAIFEQSLGPNHPKVAVCLNNLALLLQATSRLAEAEPLFRRALAIWEQSLGPNHPEVATALNNLALLLRATNRLAEAEPLCHRALAIFEQRLDPNHPNVAACLNHLALLLEATNRLAEAEPLFRRALAIAEESLVPDDPRTLLYRENLETLLGKLAVAQRSP